MEFGLSEEQTLLVDSVNRYLDGEVPLDRVRAFADDADDRADDLWRGLADLGVPALLIPEAHGGVGLSVLDAALVAEALGNHVVPVPFLSTAALAPAALMRAGSEAQQANYLPKIASGELRFGAALSELTGARRDAGIDASDGRLNGKALWAIDVASDLLLVADCNHRLHIVDSDAQGVTITALPHVDRTRPFAEVTFENAAAESLADDVEATQYVVDLGRVLLAADTLGAAQDMLDQAVEYAMQREQFNRVIASFQAVKHLCAEMAAEIEPARSLLWYAAHALGEGTDDARLTVCQAKAHLAEVGSFVAKTATMVHGGMGFTDLLGLHYWFKRIGYNRQILGGPERVRAEAAALQGLG